jgi:hypothetical protein
MKIRKGRNSGRPNELSANSESIFQFYVAQGGSGSNTSDESSSDNKSTETSNRQLTDKEAAAILGGLYGGLCEIPAGGGNSSRQKTEPNSNSAGYSLCVQGLGHKSPLLVLDRGTSDSYLDTFKHYHRIASDAFLNPEFNSCYEKLFTDSADMTPSGAVLYVYSCLAIGTLAKPVSSIDQLPMHSQKLFMAASSLIGSAVLEGTTVSAYGLASFAHLCLLSGEFLSQNKFLRMALTLLTSLGFHKRSKFQKSDYSEWHIRIFWHVYTVTYMHCIFFGDVMDILPVQCITTPLPRVDHDSSIAIDAAYLGVKIELVQLHRWAADGISSASDSPEETAEILNKLHAESEKQISLWSDFIENLTQESHSVRQMYKLILQSQSLQVQTCIYRLIKCRTYSMLRQVETDASKVVDSIRDYVLVKDYHKSSCWYICHFVFMAAIVLIYCGRLKKAENLGEDPIKIDAAIEILEKIREVIPYVAKWVEILKSLSKPQESSTPDATSPVESVSNGIPNIDEDLGGFLDYFTEPDSIPDFFFDGVMI